MKVAIFAEVTAIALAGALTVSSFAVAEVTNRECWSMADTVKAALAAHPDASQTVRDHYRLGAEACAKGYNAFGISHLQAAMKALGG